MSEPSPSVASPSSAPEVAGARRAVIRLEQLRKVYRMGEVDLEALRDVTLSIKTGEMVAIMGASGSGKSTLMNIIGCLDRPTSGRYLLVDREVSRLGRAELAELRNRTLGFVFQSFNLLTRTSAQENVELPLVYAGVSTRERRRRAREALERVGLGDRIRHHPSQLSGGQQQRVAIARALVGAPKIILADEPTGNLDSRTRIEVMQLLSELNRAGITLVIVTHEPEVAACAARIVVMRDGRIHDDRRNMPTLRELEHPEAMP
jgi:putative ABC transport system ATP-binding protein